MTKPTPTSSTIATPGAPRGAILIAAALSAQSDHEVQVSLHELRALLSGLGIPTIDRLVQRRQEGLTAMVLGSGKLGELRQMLEAHTPPEAESPVVVFDGELTPGQQRNLGEELGVDVFDRTEVILRIFARRAQTKTARLEVELARLNYEAPRLRDDSSLENQESGGGGRGGKGNTNLQLRKQMIRRQVAQVRQELEKETGQRQTRRQRREETPVVALVGYTNAGKSSLMRALTGADAYVEDQLFATLGTLVRAIPDSQPRILVADTVGFIRNLPNHLLASFRTTLDEALDADLLLHVVDASDTEWRAQMEVTRSVLQDVDASHIPTRVVFNKSDRVDAEVQRELLAEFPDALAVSAHAPTDAERLRTALVAFFEADYAEGILEIPFSRGQMIGEIHAQARVLSQSYTGDGSVLNVRARANLLREWRQRLADGEA
jgi:GTPase